MKKIVFPKRISYSSNVENLNSLLVKKPMQIGLSENATVSLKTNDFIVLDFGKELHGSIRILTFKAHNVKVRLRFGESVSECYSDVGGIKNATNDHSIRDFCVDLQDYSDMTFGGTGFRFLRLDTFGDIELKSIVAIDNYLSLKQIYTYDGNDKLIRKIFNTAKRTIDLCSSGEYIWDGIKRDRLVWIGDMHPEMLSLVTLYGKVNKIEKSLDFVKEQTPLPNFMNAIPMYSMWWIIILEDYRNLTNSNDFAMKQIDYLNGLISLMDNCVDEDGNLNYPFYFVDWPTHEKEDEVHGVRAINIIAVKKAISLLKHFNKSTELAEKLLKKLLKQEIVVKHSKQVAGLKYFAVGLNEHDKKLLIDGGAKGMSTFMSYYILTAVKSFNKEKAVDMMKEYYGAMLDVGATTFWEDFDIKWTKNACPIDRLPEKNEIDIHGDYGAYCYKGFRHSFCHGWSSGVIRFIKEL